MTLKKDVEPEIIGMLPTDGTGTTLVEPVAIPTNHPEELGETTKNSTALACEPEPEKKQNVLESHGYIVGRTIGSGSYATVKVATSEKHNCKVAVKIVSKFQAPSDYLKKFLPREIEVVKGLKHPHLIRFLQAIETTHRVYIIMEYAENGSLLDIIRRDSYIDEYRGRYWFTQIVDGVSYCHDRGVVHRDIKCENLLMDSNFHIKLSDFGFARGHMNPKDGIVPLSETFCGSYAYASPEILRGIPYQPQLSDIWSMGVVLFAIVYGRLPFDDTNYSQLLKQVQSKVTFPKEPKVSAACRSLISRILAPLRIRLRISGIRSDPWMQESSTAVSSQSSSSNTESSTETLPNLETKVKKQSSKQQVAVKLLTKEALKSAASPKPDGAPCSTDEETPLHTQQAQSQSDIESPVLSEDNKTVLNPKHNK